ncbi:MAG: rod shape-determining protein [Candidatus Babeliales bacterium]|jgi:rod shape-determining protein MreB
MIKTMFKNFLPARKWVSLFSNDIAIDLGTANTLVYVRNKGIVLDEPSVVAIKNSTKKVLAAGKAAKEMLGKTPESITACRPIRDGVIADFELTEAMLRYFIRKVHNNRRTLVAPRMIIAVPSGITQVERRAVIDSAKQAGARDKPMTIIEPMAAAIGAGLQIHEPFCSMVVDIGGGTTEVAVITLSGAVFCRSIRVGGDAMDRAIVAYIKRKYNLLIGERTGEVIKMEIGTVMLGSESKTLSVKGRDLVTGVPKTITLTDGEVNEALLETISNIVDVVRIALENTPPELSSDLVDRGIVMAGGGSLLRGLDKLLAKETGIPVRIAKNPLLCVVEGAGKVLEQLEFFKDALID